jgi:intracellular multiplication protein IcmO
MNYLDEVGAYYTERIAVQATQVRSLEFALVMMSQDQERIENQTSAANVATLMQNAGTKVAGKIVSDDKTARTISNAAGQEARANMVSLQRQDGLIGTSWIDGDHINIQMENKINVQDLIKLQPGENYTVFQGDPVPEHLSTSNLRIKHAMPPSLSIDISRLTHRILSNCENLFHEQHSAVCRQRRTSAES